MNTPESFDLPKPQPLASGAAEAHSQTAPNHAATPEADSSSPASVTPSPAGQAADPQQASAVPIPPPSQDATTAPMAVSTDDLTAEDSDLIEKEWVTRAKAIVDRTKNDPHAQNQQMNQVKAEYIKKRYNKDVKVSDT